MRILTILNAIDFLIISFIYIWAELSFYVKIFSSLVHLIMIVKTLFMNMIQINLRT